MGGGNTHTASLDTEAGRSSKKCQHLFSCFRCGDYLQQFLSSMAAKYELPEKVNEKCLRTPGRDVEVKTFKTNVAPEKETSESDYLVITCVGDCTGVQTKGVFIDDYRQVQPDVKSCKRPVIGVDFHLKTIKWQRRVTEEPVLTRIQFWEIAEQERFSNMTRLYFRFSHGALVFWGTRRPSTLEGATKWRQEVRNHLSSIPCVLVTDNVTKPGHEPLQWVGPGKIFESEVALDQFCKDHGFVDHFEIKSRDWKSGEKSVFGEAVNFLLKIIFNTEQKEANVIR